MRVAPIASTTTTRTRPPTSRSLLGTTRNVVLPRRRRSVRLRHSAGCSFYDQRTTEPDSNMALTRGQRDVSRHVDRAPMSSLSQVDPHIEDAHDLSRLHFVCARPSPAARHTSKTRDMQAVCESRRPDSNRGPLHYE